MGDYFFGLHDGHLTEQADQIADWHGAYHENYTEPGGRKRGRFGCPNRGVPFDQRTADAVLADIDAVGGIDALREGATPPRAPFAWEQAMDDEMIRLDLLRSEANLLVGALRAAARAETPTDADLAGGVFSDEEDRQWRKLHRTRLLALADSLEPRIDKLTAPDT